MVPTCLKHGLPGLWSASIPLYSSACSWRSIQVHGMHCNQASLTLARLSGFLAPAVRGLSLCPEPPQLTDEAVPLRGLAPATAVGL